MKISQANFVHLAWAALMYLCVPAAQACGDGGSTCSGAEPATQASRGGNVGAGNPINVITGNKYQREVDMPPLPGVLGLEIVRHYNSALSGPQTRPGALGRGWRLSYESALYLTATGVQIDQPDGSLVLFGKDLGSSNVLLPRDPSQGKLEIIKSSRGDEYLWTWSDGRKLRFNHRGKLEQIQAPTGEVLTMQYDARGLLLRVTDPQGRTLQLGWLDAETAKRGDRFRGVQTIDSPLGRFTYGYGSPVPKGANAAPVRLLANLVKVSYPAAGEGRRYHYESAQHPTLMTGISIDGPDAAGKPSSLRYATFGYRADGRAILSTHANDVDKVTLDYTSADTTTVTNSLGQKTTYRFRSFYSEDRLLEVRGAGCSLCGEPNVRYGYDSLGRLTSTTQLDANGAPLKTTLAELDRYGRPLKVSQVAYVGGKAQAPQWQQRYEYAPGGASFPVLIARPSVVPGREYVTRIAYQRLREATSLPVRISEQGFVPALDGKSASYAIERTVSHRYNAYGQRTETDGPLPNAAHASPSNSDITLIEYDRKTKLVTTMTAPGGVVTQVLERDAALRPSKVSVNDGNTLQTTSVRYNLRGEAEEVGVETVLLRNGTPDKASRVSRVLRYRYDLMGNLASVTLPGDVTTRFVYDAAGRLTQRIDPDGSRVATVQDSEGRLVSEGRYLDADMTPAKALATIRTAGSEPGTGSAIGTIDHDELMRPVAWRTADGAIAARASWGAAGTAAQASVLAIDTGSARAERLVDDFGQVTAIRNPGQGWQLARHDPAGHILQSVDPRGARQVAQWDAAGRLTKLTRYAAGATAPEQTLTYRYAGALLVGQTIADADGSRQTVNTYDAAGRIVRQTLDILPAGSARTALGAPVHMAHSWRYDANGALVALTFTDNTGASVELKQDVDSAGRTRRIATRGVLPDMLGGRRAIAAAIDWQPGIDAPFAQRIVHGDNTADQYEGVPAPQPSAPSGPDMPRVQPAGMELAPAASPRLAPGRDQDVAGLPAAITTSVGDERLEWNAAGQLARTVRADGSTRYLYDADGQRVARLVTDAQERTTATLFFYHDNHLVAEADAGGRAQYAYAYLGWRPLAQIDLRSQSWAGDLKRWLFGAPVRHLHTDRVGRVTSMTDNGNAVWTDDTPTEPQVIRVARQLGTGVHQPLRYVSQYHDTDSGLAYHGARYFDPGRGRFLSPDPAGIPDALNGVPRALLLDLYAYAGGRPDEYFDPDGAARIRYFAITTDTSEKAIAIHQGYTPARWAFIVDDVKSGFGTTPLMQKQNEYAQKGTALLVDVGGNFLKGKTVSATWTGSDSQEAAFTQHYGDSLISVPEFTITMDDADAAKLIASYIPEDSTALFGKTCPARGKLLPQIAFAKEDLKIDVTNPTANGAHKSRILPCGEGSKDDIDMRRVAKYEAASEINETGRINRDCSKDGCPGIGYYCDEKQCLLPRDQLNFGPPNTKEPVYTPSYGRSQFIGSTLVSELLSAYQILTPAELAALGLTPEMKNTLKDAATRAAKMAAWYQNTPAAASYADANKAWTNLSAANKTKFTAETGLGEREFVDMARIITAPPKNTKGRSLANDAKAALITTSIMSDSTVEKFLMGMFKDFDKFTKVSHMLMQKNLNAAKKYQPKADEKYLAAMVARAHNGGTWQKTYPLLTTQDEHDYVKNFIGVGAKFTNKGDWVSLRCTETLGKDTVKPGTSGKGIGGLEMETLKLN